MTLSGFAVVVLVGIGVFSGCGRSPAGAQPAEPSGSPVVSSAMTDGGAASPCPMAIPGATAAVADVDRGVAVTFTAPPDAVEALRTRVRQMAEREGGLPATCPCMAAMRGDGGATTERTGEHMHGMRTPPAEARVEDVEGGARLVLTAKDTADVSALRAHVRTHLEHMKGGGCGNM